MNKILRYSFIAVLAFICNVSFADTVVTFTAGTDNGSYDAADKGAAGADKITKDGVTIETSYGAFAAVNKNTNAAEYRIYKSSSFKASVTSGTIKKIVFTCTAKGKNKQGPGCFDGEGYTYEEDGYLGTWIGNAASVTLNASSNQVRATKIEVTIDANGQGSGETPTPPVETKKAENIAAFKALESGTTAILNLNNAQVIYKNVYKTNSGTTNTEYYVRDASGAIQFYNTGLELNENQILNGTVEVKYSPYYEMPQAAKATNTSADNLNITDGEVAVPTKVTVADLSTDKYLADLVTVENVKFTSEKSGKYTNNYLVNDDDKVMVYDKFKRGITFPTDEATYNVTGIFVTAKLSGNIVKELAPTVAPTTTTNINNITTDATSVNAPAYNLAGQKVSASYKGVVIKAGKKYIQK